MNRKFSSFTNEKRVDLDVKQGLGLVLLKMMLVELERAVKYQKQAKQEAGIYAFSETSLIKKQFVCSGLQWSI